MGKNIINTMIGGAAGEGLVTVGNILARSLVRSGYSIVVTQSYQSRIRGGHNTFAIRAGINDIFAPQEKIDLLVAFDGHTVNIHKDELSLDGIILVDDKIDVQADKICKVPYKDLTTDRFSNIAALGVICSVLGLDAEQIKKTIKDAFIKKKNMALENEKVFNKAYEWSKENAPSNFEKLDSPKHSLDCVMLNGNEAIALGALSAGVKFCSFYPMTPSTSIALNLSAHSNEMELVVEQAEDEISAINMALGASFTGAPSMVTTSGGGFALMIEGISLAAITETPVVAVIAQRPGPATGLPTRTEQGDLEMVLHAGHGEFPRTIFAPGTIEECFHLTRKAFELAENFQGPMFILTDQFLADSYRSVKPFKIKDLSSVKQPTANNSSDSVYKRYAFTENGVSPRLLPGTTRNLVVADSDEHTEDGHITEDLSIRTKMVQKRLKKNTGIIDAIVPPEFYGHANPDILIVSWGSSKGPVIETINKMNEKEEKYASLHFSQVWPLNPANFAQILKNAGKVVCVEGNATAQFARLIRRETGFNIEKRILKYDGLPFTPEAIIKSLNIS